MKIKVCGLKYPDNVAAVAALHPDYMGFIFYDKTPRFVGGLPLSMMQQISSAIKKTAVFVNQSAEAIIATINEYNFDAIQLHGSETAAFCGNFKGKVTVIKAFGLSDDFNFGQLNEYADKVDYFLFDTKTVIHGGSGNTFNWAILNRYNLNVPFFLSGGLALENLEDVKNIDHPQFYGVDLNSRFETGPAVKDINKLKKAFDIVKQTTHEVRS